MKVFAFDLLAYGENLEHLKTGTELPYPLSKQYFRADVAVCTYAEHLAAREEMDELDKAHRVELRIAHVESHSAQATVSSSGSTKDGDREEDHPPEGPRAPGRRAGSES